MLKNCFDTLLKNNKKNIHISYLNSKVLQNDFENYSIQKSNNPSYSNIKKSFNISTINRMHDLPDKYSDFHYQPCRTCEGSGFVENSLRDISKLEMSDENKYKNTLEKNKHLSPYKICKSCHGTGKKDSDVVFYYTCCQNKNKV